MQDTENTATGRAVILEIVRAMRENLEPLVFSTIAPSRFYVYLHPADHKRLEGIFPLIAEQARKALDEEVRRVNEKSAADKLKQWFSKEPAMAAIEVPRDGWEIRVEPDLDGEMQPGDIAVASELVLPAAPELAGSRTRRVTTIQSGGHASRREQVLASADLVPSLAASSPSASARDSAGKIERSAVEGNAAAPAGTASGTGATSGTTPSAAAGRFAADGTVIAILTYQDQQGSHRFAMSKNEIVVGRGGVGYWVDVKLNTSADVSREHIRVRRDPASGQFFLKDLSTLGTTLDGQAVPSSIEVVEGHRRDKGIEVPLPPRARIGLAGIVFLEFESGGRP